MKRSGVLLGAMLLVACASGPAGPPPRMVTPLMLEPPPIYALLGFREKLALSTPQITALDSIATWVRSVNSPLVDTLQAYSVPNRYSIALQVDSAHQAVLDSVQAHNHQAAAAVGAVLDSTQEQTACHIFQQEREQRAEAWRSGERGERGEPGQARPGTRRPTRRTAAADSIAPLGFRVWPWCKMPEETGKR